jgi:hypothetical protein
MDKSQYFAAVRVALGVGYDPSEGNRWASRNGLVSSSPPEIPHVTIRDFFTAVHPPRLRSLLYWMY